MTTAEYMIIPTHGRLGDIEIVLETQKAPGSEDTAACLPTNRAHEILSKIQHVVVHFAEEIGSTLKDAAHRVEGADAVSVEFGLSATYEGTVVFVSAAATASFKVTVTYNRHTREPEAK